MLAVTQLVLLYLSDIAALRYDYRYEYKKYHQENGVKHTDNILLEVYLRYADEDLINLLEFDNISERYAASNFKYVIGTVKLQHLIKNRDLLLDSDVFIAYTGRQIYKEEKIVTQVYEEAVL